MEYDNMYDMQHGSFCISVMYKVARESTGVARPCPVLVQGLTSASRTKDKGRYICIPWLRSTFAGVDSISNLHRKGTTSCTAYFDVIYSSINAHLDLIGNQDRIELSLDMLSAKCLPKVVLMCHITCLVGSLHNCK